MGHAIIRITELLIAILRRSRMIVATATEKDYGTVGSKEKIHLRMWFFLLRKPFRFTLRQKYTIVFKSHFILFFVFFSFFYFYFYFLFVISCVLCVVTWHCHVRYVLKFVGYDFFFILN